MEFIGKLKQILNPITGEGKNGQWKKQEIIIELNGKFTKEVCLNIWQDKVEIQNFNIGDELRVKFDIESKEFKGRWYSELKAWEISKIEPDSKKSDNTTSQTNHPEDPLPF